MGSGGVGFTLGTACFVSDRNGLGRLSERRGKFVEFFTRREEQQKVNANVASAFPYICRLLEALDILEDVLKTYHKGLRFYRDIALSLQGNDTVFELMYVIIRSGGNPSVQQSLDAIVHEWELRTAAKKSGKMRDPNHDTVWCDLPDEQVEMLYDMLMYLDEQRGKDNDIVLQGLLPLRFRSPSSLKDYLHKAAIYVKTLAEAIRRKYPQYGFEVTLCGIYFHDKNGMISFSFIESPEYRTRTP